MTTANVVDVSEWQPTSIDWANLKANGVKAVVVRIGHGTTRDTNAADHIANATKAGLIVHVYHYYEGVDGELQYSVNNAKSLNIQPNVYYFLDMEGTIAGSWPSIFESFRKRWAGYGWNTGLYCSLSNYAKFDNATLVKQGVYRWIAAWGSSQPSNADMWQYDNKTGLGSYTSALDKDADIAGKLVKEPDSTIVEPTDPNGNYTIKPGAFVGFDHSTTELQGGEMLVASPDGKNKIPKLAPTGAFLFNNADGDNMWTLIKPKIQMPKLDWSTITNKPDVALKSDVAAVSAVASTASAKADSNAKLIADKASQEDLNNVSSTASSVLDKATSNANALASKVNKSDLTWTNITNRPDVDSIASQASQAVVTANTAESQASAAGQAAASATAQASAAKTTADTATATANAAKASASTACATAASAQKVANSASASASATAVALKSKADTATVNAQFTAVNSSVASAQSTADSAVAGLAGKLDKTALTWGNIANKPTNLATTESVAKAQSAANSAVSMASGATATANTAKSAATSAVGVANTANTTANSALTKANSATTVANSANTTANTANNNATSAVSVANGAKSTADNVNNRLWSIQANGGGRNLLQGTRDFSGVSIQGSKVAVTNGQDKFQAAYGTQGSSQTYFDLLTFNAIPLEKNTDYTASFWVKTSENTDIWSFLYDSGSNGNYADGATISQSTTDYTRVVVHFHNGNNNATPNFIPVRINKKSTITVWVYGCMLEKGTVAHDWSPAPEDVQTQIDANKTAAANAQTSANNAQTSANSALSKANNAQNTANSAQTSANNAQNTANSAQSTANTAKSTADSALSKANSNATALNSKASKSDLTWANISGKPSIPDNDATTTVSSGDLNNYTTTGKYYMPNSLSYYANHPTTGIDMGNWFVMKVDSYIGGLMIIQTIYQINTGDVWIRQRWSNSWKSWRQINFWG
nr:GH25 family lysozyme [Limosilactobacillus mucosae]